MNVNTGPRWTDTFMGRIVIHLLSSCPSEQMEAYWAMKKTKPGGDCEVTVTIDGMEFDFKLFSDHVEKQLNQMVAERAGALLQDRTGDLMQKLQDSIDELVNGIRKQAADALGYNPWENER